MKKTILILALVFVAFVAVASVTDPPAHNGEGKSRIYYFVHPYIAYHTYTVAPVVYYPRYYVAPVYPVYPVYRVYPVYTYQYWYNRFAAPKPSTQVLQSGSDVKVERPADIKR